MSQMLTGFLYFGLDAVAVVLLVAIWQRTRILGFTLLALSYLIGMLARPAYPLMLRMMTDGDASTYDVLSLVYTGVHVLAAVVALAGLLNIYLQLRRPAAPVA